MRRTLAAMRWSDMDALGHVHNARFLEYFEAARADLVNELVDIGRPAGMSLLVARHEIDYLAPLVYRPTPVPVDLWVERIGNSSITVGYVVTEADHSVVYGKAITVMVAVDMTTGRAMTLPDFIREALQPYLREDGDMDPTRVSTTTQPSVSDGNARGVGLVNG